MPRKAKSRRSAKQKATFSHWSGPFPFLKLPVELQIRIFEKLLEPVKGVNPIGNIDIEASRRPAPYPTHKHETKGYGRVHPLFLVSKGISEVFRHVFYRSTILLLSLGLFNELLDDDCQALQGAKREPFFTRIFLQLNLLCVTIPDLELTRSVGDLRTILKSLLDDKVGCKRKLAIEVRTCMHYPPHSEDGLSKVYKTFFDTIRPYQENIVLGIILEDHGSKIERSQYIAGLMDFAAQAGISFKSNPQVRHLDEPVAGGHHMPAKARPVWYGQRLCS